MQVSGFRIYFLEPGYFFSKILSEFRKKIVAPHLVPSPFSAVYAIVEENSPRDVPRVHKKTLSHLAKGRTPVFFNPFICPAGRDGQ